jgi:hypothetical protein
VDRLRQSPTSLADAFSVIWAIDAYAVHIAAHLSVEERLFKDQIIAEGGWQYRLLREASSATKHAITRNEFKRDVGRSDKINTSEVDGWAWYFSNAKHWGPQICIVAAWKIDDQTGVWRDAEAKPIVGGGPFFNIVPVLDLIEPALHSLERRLT